MDNNPIEFSVFTKPWKLALPELGKQVKSWGFDGIELPVRPGYQVLPENIGRDLPKAVKVLSKEGVKVFSIAGPTDEATIAACAEAGVPVIRIMVPIGDDGYLATEARYQKDFDNLLPLLQKYGVKIGVQNHLDRFVSNASGLRHLIEKYDPELIGAVWDAAVDRVVNSLRNCRSSRTHSRPRGLTRFRIDAFSCTVLLW